MRNADSNYDFIIRRSGTLVKYYSNAPVLIRWGKKAPPGQADTEVRPSGGEPVFGSVGAAAAAPGNHCCIRFFTKRIRIEATWARVALPLGSR